jgi:RNA polymerase sigma-70 factor (ECF subfamily)
MSYVLSRRTFALITLTRHRRKTTPMGIEQTEFRISPEDMKALYENHAAQVKRFFQKRRTRDVEDLVQTVYAEALATTPRNAVLDPVKYLFGIARNVLHTDYRRFHRECSRLTFVDPEELASVPATEQILSEVDAIGACELSCRRIEDALNGMPRRCQLAFVRSRRDGRSYNEIAVELGVTAHTVKKYIVRALEHLRSRSITGTCVDVADKPEKAVMPRA